ncbi:MAG: antitoxin [Acidobacteriota bacterium]|jgi:predicted DNA binding CopG/RHH family protein|nr:antitoxin [Acidobacteriota bacterium]
MKLTKEEKVLLDSVENGEWSSVPEASGQAERYREAAVAALRKDRRVNIRLAERDLIRLQKAAIREGLPYQTLIASVLHKYVDGQFVEKRDSPDIL